jgi:photosystem II stability/assembly factor-like uncharacterized protein
MVLKGVFSFSELETNFSHTSIQNVKDYMNTDLMIYNKKYNNKNLKDQLDIDFNNLTTKITYKINNPGGRWATCCMSSDSKYQMAVQYYKSTEQIFNSSDNGSTWTPVTIQNENYGFWSTGMSYDGKYRIISSLVNNNVYISRDYGITWEKINIKNDSEVNVGISGTGQYITFTTFNDNPNYDDDGGKVWTSNDYGNTWNNVTQNFNVPGYYYNVAISQDGKYQTLTITSSSRGDISFPSSIVTSNDYGLTWSIISNLGKNICTNAMSYDGKYQIAGDYGSDSAGIYKSKDYGKTWDFIQTEKNDLWIAGALSSDGKYQIYVSQKPYVIYRSSDYGETWIRSKFVSNSSIYGVGMSANGKNLVITPPLLKIYSSTDYGETWNNNNNTIGYKAFTNISSSLDCSYQTATIFNGKILISKDYGESWSEILDNDEWRSISISENGQYQTALTTNDIHISNNFGNSWKKIPRANVGSGNVKISGNGQYQTYTEYPGDIYISSDYGETWKKANKNVDIALFYNPPKMSSDGKIQFTNDVLGTNFDGAGSIYISNDYGENWKKIDSAGQRSWSSIECSSDGKYIYAGSYNTGYIRSNNYGVNWIYPTTTDTHYNFRFSLDAKYQVYTKLSPLKYNATYVSSDYGENFKVLSKIKNVIIYGLSSSSDRLVFLANNAIIECFIIKQ